VCVCVCARVCLRAFGFGGISGCSLIACWIAEAVPIAQDRSDVDGDLPASRPV
jgi:hypothetical protein